MKKKNSRCAKCGRREITFKYHRGHMDCPYFSSSCCGEHLHYVCSTCGYNWTGDIYKSKNPKGGRKK